MAMTPIRPELGLQDWSPIARGGEAYGRGIGQGLAALGQGIGKAIEKHRLDKKEKADLEEFTQFANQFNIKPDEAKVAWKTGGREGAWQWLNGVKQQRQSDHELSLGLQILGNLKQSGTEFNMNDYMSWYSAGGGQSLATALRVLDIGTKTGLLPENLSEMDKAQLDHLRAQTEAALRGKAPSPTEVDKHLDNQAEAFMGLPDAEKEKRYSALPPEVRSRVDNEALERKQKEKALGPKDASPFTKAERERQYEREIDGITLGEYARKLRDLESGATKGQLDAKWWKPGIFEQDRIPEFDRILSQNPELFLEGTSPDVIANIGKGESFKLINPGGSVYTNTAR